VWPTLAVIVGSLFFGFYLFRVSYFFLTFFITIIVGQLYIVLNEFSVGLLVLRLEETAIGAAAAFLVTFLVLPVSTTDTVREARKRVLDGVADVLDAAADRLGGPQDGQESPPNIDALARTVDNSVRQLRVIATPLTRPRPTGGDAARWVRYWLTRYMALATYTRAIPAAVRRRERDTTSASALAEMCRSLARLARQRSGSMPEEPEENEAGPAGIERIGKGLRDSLCEGEPPQHRLPLTRSLIHIHGLLAEIGAALAARSGRGPVEPEQPGHGTRSGGATPAVMGVPGGNRED
jgi:uncharacterized membrane protein YccC